MYFSASRFSSIAFQFVSQLATILKRFEAELRLSIEKFKGKIVDKEENQNNIFENNFVTEKLN